MKTVTFDTETTGTDTDNDRILTCYMRAKDGERTVYEGSWVIDPGVEVPEGAAEVHGMTTEWIREHGRRDVRDAICEIVDTLGEYANDGFVVAGYNHSFDLAMLHAEYFRHTQSDMRNWFLPHARYIDPCIFSRVFDKYVKGGHQLITVAKRNGIEIEEDRLHAADYDVEVTEKLVPIMLNRAWKELADLRKGLTPDEFVTKLQEWQADQKKDWALHLTEYFGSIGKTEEDGSPIKVSGAFPF